MITYDVLETKQALQFFENNINFLGKIHSIEHQRLKFETEYKTVIKGSDETLTINGGLSSGYPGEGPKGLIKVLERLGVSSAAAEKYAKDRETYKKGFKHQFIVGLE